MSNNSNQDGPVLNLEQLSADVEKLKNLQQEMIDSLEEIRTIAKRYKDHGLNYENFDRYVFANIEVALTQCHGYMAREQSLDDVIDSIDDDIRNQINAGPESTDSDEASDEE